MAKPRRIAAVMVGLLTVVALALTVASCARHLREDAVRSARRASMHSTGLAMAMHRQEHDGAYPTKLDILIEEGYAEGHCCPLKRWPELGWQYVIPGSDADDEVVLFYWPPVKGKVEVLFQDLDVRIIPVDDDGNLVNPRSGEIIRQANQPQGSLTE